jgi:hypothetical protein
MGDEASMKIGPETIRSPEKTSQGSGVHMWRCVSTYLKCDMKITAYLASNEVV